MASSTSLSSKAEAQPLSSSTQPEPGTTKFIIPAPPMDLFARSDSFLQILRYDPEKDNTAISLQFNLEASEMAFWSPCGNWLAINPSQNRKQVKILNTDSYEVESEISGNSKIRNIAFSPLSTYIVLWYINDANEPNPQNLTIWDIKKKAPILIEPLKAHAHSVWPHFQWSSRETVCCKLVNSDVSIYKGDDLTQNKASSYIRVARMQNFKISPEDSAGNVYIAIFVAQQRGVYPYIAIYNSNDPKSVLSKRTCTQGEDVTFAWNAQATALLTRIRSDKSVTGSYYGLDALYFLRSNENFTSVIVPADKGPVHDFQWHPLGNMFLLCQGPMPAQIFLCDGEKGVPFMNIISGRVNTVLWNRFGRFFALGGFGNLAGQLDFWENAKKRRCVGSTEASCAVDCCFAPDGRHFSAATTTPRLRVNNCIKIYKYTGELKVQKTFDKLLEAQWKPFVDGIFLIRGVSKESRAIVKEAKQVKTSDVYRTPQARLQQMATKSTQYEADLGKKAIPINVNASQISPGAPGMTKRNYVKKGK